MQGLREQNKTLRIALIQEWLDNHSEHCGHIVPPWPHEGKCKWPMPLALAGESATEVYSLLLLALEECAQSR